MQQYFIKQFAEHFCHTPDNNNYTTGTMTETRTIEGNDQDKNFSEFEIYSDMCQKNFSTAATGTFTDSIEGVDQDINRISDFF
jgi:hypothetical protein